MSKKRIAERALVLHLSPDGVLKRRKASTTAEEFVFGTEIAYRIFRGRVLNSLQVIEKKSAKSPNLIIKSPEGHTTELVVLAEKIDIIRRAKTRTDKIGLSLKGKNYTVRFPFCTRANALSFRNKCVHNADQDKFYTHCKDDCSGLESTRFSAIYRVERTEPTQESWFVVFQCPETVSVGKLGGLFVSYVMFGEEMESQELSDSGEDEELKDTCSEKAFHLVFDDDDGWEFELFSEFIVPVVVTERKAESSRKQLLTISDAKSGQKVSVMTSAEERKQLIMAQDWIRKLECDNNHSVSFFQFRTHDEALLFRCACDASVCHSRSWRHWKDEVEGLTKTSESAVYKVETPSEGEESWKLVLQCKRDAEWPDEIFVDYILHRIGKKSLKSISSPEKTTETSEQPPAKKPPPTTPPLSPPHRNFKKFVENLNAFEDKLWQKLEEKAHTRLSDVFHRHGFKLEGNGENLSFEKCLDKTLASVAGRIKEIQNALSRVAGDFSMVHYIKRGCEDEEE